MLQGKFASVPASSLLGGGRGGVSVGNVSINQ